MPGIVIVGAQWGDEGKGKFVDVLTHSANMVVRFQGGNNAGHTIVIDGVKTALSLLPSGILRPGIRCVLAAGVVINPEVLIAEIERLRGVGVEISPSRLLIDRDAQLVLDYHVALDKAREEYRGNARIGTTGKGIGPAYEDRCQRSGIRFADLLFLDGVKERIRAHVKEKNLTLRHVLDSEIQIEFEPLWNRLVECAGVLAEFIGDGSRSVHEALNSGERVVFEGAQGVLLDQVHGTYPFVTSSNTVAGSASTGVGVGPNRLDAIIGITKAYTTRVGAGPFPTEVQGGVGDLLRSRGHEFGTVTGRPRRCGWFDAVAVKRAIRLSGIDSLILTKLDVLSGLSTIKVCVAYRRGDQVFDDLPALVRDYDDLIPEYIELPGWNEDITKVSKFNQLPEAARSLVAEIGKIVRCPINMVSVGPGREETIELGMPEVLGEFVR
jgi:adenylosuccinate synthase